MANGWMSPLKIAFVNPSGQIGGAERALLLLLGQLDRELFAPTVICLGDGPLLRALERFNVPAMVVSLGRGARLSRSTFSSRECLSGVAQFGQTGFRLLRALQRINPDLIHTNGIKAHLLGGVAGRLMRRPVVWHMRDLVSEARLRRLFDAAANVLPHRIIGVSTPVTGQFSGSRAVTRAHTVHDAVDPANYRPRRLPEAVRASLGLRPDAFVIAMVAHFARWKGHLVFLEALARVAEQDANVQGLVIGGSVYSNATEQEYESEVKAFCRNRKLEKNVVFTGYQEHVPDFLNAADILAHLPIRPEPFGLSVIEAMLLRKPVVAAKAGGILETVQDGATGFLVAPDNPSAAATALLRLIGDPTLRQSMGESGHQRVCNLFNPDIHYRRIARIFEDTIAAA